MNKMQIQYVRPEQLHQGTQPRLKQDDPKLLLAIAATLALAGMKYPILARLVQGNLIIIDGHRRHAAALLAKLKEVPVIVVEGDITDADALLGALICNCQRLDLDPVEKARAYARVMAEMNLTAAELARRIGTSEAGISRLTTMLTAPQEVLDRVQNGALPASTAYQIAIAGDKATQLQLLDETTQKGLSRERLVRRIRHDTQSPVPTKPRRKTMRVTLPLGDASLAISGPALTLDELAKLMESLLGDIRNLASKDIPLKDLRKALSAQTATSKHTAA